MTVSSKSAVGLLSVWIVSVSQAIIRSAPAALGERASRPHLSIGDEITKILWSPKSRLFSAVIWECRYR